MLCRGESDGGCCAEDAEKDGCAGASAGTGRYVALRGHPFFSELEPPIDFSAVGTQPPPPLVPPPPPLPSINGDRVHSSQLAERSNRLLPEDRAMLLEHQSGLRWAQFLHAGESELIILASQVLKRRHLSVKRRQLILSEGELWLRRA